MQKTTGSLRPPRLRELWTARPARLLAAGAIVAVAGGGWLNATSAAAAGPAPGTAPAHVWITTANGADKLSDLGTVNFSTTPSTAPAVVIDPTLTYQTMQGFGGAITDSSASVLYGLPAGQRAGRDLGHLRRPIRHRQWDPDPVVEPYWRHQPAVAAHAAIQRHLHLHRPQQR